MSDATQDKPVMDGADDATRAEKLEGIVEQTEADIAVGSEAPEDAAATIEERAKASDA